MKNYLPLFFLIPISVLFMQSCSPTMNLTIPVKVPPKVIIPDHVAKIGVVDRSSAGDTKGRQVANVLEGVVTGEGILEDRNGAIACVSGAAARLNNDQLVTAHVLDTVKLSGTGTGTMPIPLSWTEVKRICKQNGVDALLVLETFDTDQSGTVTSSTVNQIRNVAQGGTIRPPVPSSNARVRVKIGFRLYDPQTRGIIDDVRLNDYFGVNSNRNGIPDMGEFAKRGAIQESAYLGGYSYGSRTLPSWIRLRREFYQRKGNEMKRATRMVEVNQWEDAKAIWEPLTRSSNDKLAGRACYNMGIAAEVAGDIPLAIEWAQKSYTNFGDNRGRDYVRVLKRRL